MIEVTEPSRLPIGVLAPEVADAGTDRDQRGRFVAGATASAAKGGRARKYRTRLAASLGLSDLAEAGAFAIHLREAEDVGRELVTDIATRSAGGVVGPDVVIIVRSAVMQSAASAYLFALAIRSAGDPDLLARASKLGNDARQNFIAARELAIRTAKSRPEKPAALWADSTVEDEDLEPDDEPTDDPSPEDPTE